MSLTPGAKAGPTPRAHRSFGAVRIPGRRRLGVYVVAGGVWSTGALWLVWRYLLRVPGPFGPQTSPLEPWWLKAHALFAFASVWSFGLLWGVHVVNGWVSRRSRWSGGAVFGASVFLIATGYLLDYAGDERLRDPVAYAHWIVGLVAALVFAWHRSARHRMRRASGAASP